jgi:hypothetical protein
MKAIVQTRSNFKNCNGRELQVQECNGSFITCLVPMYGFDAEGQPLGDMVSASFILKEIIFLHS